MTEEQAQTPEQAPTKTASERLEQLERTMLEVGNALNQVIQAIQPIDLLVKDATMLKETLKLLNGKLEATVEALNGGKALTEENLSQIMTKNSVQELVEKTNKMVTTGLFVPVQEVAADSFVVISETNSKDVLVTPRMQFLLSQLGHEETRGKLVGVKVGDSITIGDGGDKVTVLEAYNIVLPQAPAAEAAPAESAPAPTSEAATA